MKDSELQFDRTSHVLYSKPCKRQIREKIALHYPEGECETISPAMIKLLLLCRSSFAFFSE